MDTSQAIAVATAHLCKLPGHVFDLLTLTKPVSPEAALNLAKVISKLSPLLGNLIEFNTVEFLNSQSDFQDVGKWRRQDPGFPDTVLDGIEPVPGFEIKAWFPLATEITARFKDSQRHFVADNTHVCMIAWLPEHLIFGKPYILGTVVSSGLSIAQARDAHYHDPPDYLVLEPEDTSSRTRNLQQTNTAGYKWQGTAAQFEEARRMVQSWGVGGRDYKPTFEYQRQLRQLIALFPYRLDTNYAKMDRIVHTQIEDFKKRIRGMTVNGMTIDAWDRLLKSGNDGRITEALATHLHITRVGADALIE